MKNLTHSELPNAFPSTCRLGRSEYRADDSTSGIIDTTFISSLSVGSKDETFVSAEGKDSVLVSSGELAERF